MFLAPLKADAGVLGGVAHGHYKDFYDWDYAKTVWSQMGTWEAEEKEWAKYSADYDPWFEIYKVNHQQAKAVLKTYPPEKRKNIERAYDIQMVWDTWYDGDYGPWLYRYRGIIQVRTTWDERIAELKTFEQSFAERNRLLLSSQPKPCVPQEFVSECGPIPDWRSPEMKAEERKLEARREELRKTKR